ncbi:hypothetical protein CFP56_019840 [Quercus suber]|uniref:Uncharacterized protein n=1 Tax=Quercus suber TaxID=58331 RepID=A0AAW0M0B8_QUESU
MGNEYTGPRLFCSMLSNEERIISRFGSIVVEFFWYYCCTVIEADVELKEEEKHLKSMLKQQAIQMAEQRRHFEEQQASQMAQQIAHYDNMMMQMLSYITSQSAQSSKAVKDYASITSYKNNSITEGECEVAINV